MNYYLSNNASSVFLKDFLENEILSGGQIVKSGDSSLAHQLEAEGYGWIEGEAATQEARA